MAQRIWNLVVILCWLTSMSWLVVTKMMPAMVGGDPPDYRSRLDARTDESEGWRIRWKDQTVGHAVSQVVEGSHGHTEQRSVVRFDRLPVAAIARHILGGMAALVEPVFAETPDLQVAMRIATRMRYDAAHRLCEMSTVVDVSEVEELLRLEGTVDANGTLALVAMLGEDGAATGVVGRRLFRRQIELPRHALVNHSVEPRSQLRNLRVGQRWTLPVYRVFPPNRPLQIIQAVVERHEIIFWEGSDVETMLVVYRPDPGSQVQAARETLGREWIREDGTILRQEVTFAGLELSLERMGNGTSQPLTELLDAGQHPRLWPAPSPHLTAEVQ